VQVQPRGRLGDVEVRVDVRSERQAGLRLGQCRPDRDRDEIGCVVATDHKLVEEAQILGGHDRMAVFRMPERAPRIAVARLHFRKAHKRPPDACMRPQAPRSERFGRLVDHDLSPVRPVRIEYREDFLISKNDERGSLRPTARTRDGAGDVAETVGRTGQPDDSQGTAAVGRESQGRRAPRQLW